MRGSFALRATDRNQVLAAQRLEEQADDAVARANIIRETLLLGKTITEDQPEL